MRHDEEALRKMIIELAKEYGRYEYRRITTMPRSQVPESAP
jgi:hypothetical protein